MAVKTESTTTTKGKPGRKRTFPEGSLEYRFQIPPATQEALSQFIMRQTVQPKPSAVFLAALNKFLVEEGDLDP